MKSFAPLKNCWFLTGPTATGKTGVGLELAGSLDAEIVSLDSMAVYRGMDLGTAKPSPAEQARVAHHLIDVVDPHEEFSLSEYVAAAHAKVTEIHERQRTALFVGGTPLYLKALLRGLFPGPPADWEFRAEIEAEIQRVGLEALHTRLQQVDPLAASRLHPHDKRRIIRALEVNRTTGRPLSHEQTQFDEPPSPNQCHVFALSRERAALHQRIELRVETMFERGLVDEVSGLLGMYGGLSRTAMQAVGYREVVAHVSGGPSLTQTVEQVKTRTRQFARRQATWFRSLDECRQVAADDSDSPANVAQRIRELADATGV